MLRQVLQIMPNLAAKIMNSVLPAHSCSHHDGRLGIVLLALLLSATVARAAVFQDYFTNRETILTTSGSLSGNNSTATIEVGEPRHGGKPGGHSLWVSWIAPTNGVAAFDTHGSSLDTTLSAYFLGSTNDTTVDKLREAARNDDDPGFQPASLIQFGALAGHRYEIALDGYEGATGSITLNWSFISVASPPPIILSTPNDQAAQLGDTVSLAVNMNATADLQFKWFFYDNEVENEDGVNTTNLVITSLQATNVGVYSLRISIGNVRFFTTPVEIQINSDGANQTLAQNKLLDSSVSPLIGDDGHHGGGPGPIFPPPPGPTIGVVRGYNGSQVFNTTLATADPAEPPHCGVSGGASYWLMYQPPTNGTITLDTIGSAYDTVMEAYTFNGALMSYADLISVACDNDGVASHGASRVAFQVVKTRQYIIVVDGINGARGVAWLNYVLNTNQPATPPAPLSQVATQTVAAGSSVLLAPPIGGAPPMKYGWLKDGVVITNSQTSWLLLTNVVPSQSGNYTLSVTNDLGNLTVSIPLHVVVPPQCSMAASVNGLMLGFPTATGLRYTIEQADTVTGPWLPGSSAFLGDGQNYFTNISCLGTKFFRVRVE
jgi:hypothetical protein